MMVYNNYEECGKEEEEKGSTREGGEKLFE